MKFALILFKKLKISQSLTFLEKKIKRIQILPKKQLIYLELVFINRNLKFMKQ